MVSMKDVHMAYGTGTEALKGVSFEIQDGEFAFLVGPSGSGKSTILNLLTAELHATQGSICVNGFEYDKLKSRQVPKLRRSIGVIFQDFRLIEKKTVYENVAFAMRVIGASSKEVKNRVPYVLELVGLGSRLYHTPAQLSGGQQQRVAIARALMNNPPVILADEPTGNLDTKSSIEIITFLQQLNSQGITIVMVTHEDDIAAYAKRRIVMRDGVIVREDDPSKGGKGEI